MKRPSHRFPSQLIAPDPNEQPVLEPLLPTGGPLTPERRPVYHHDQCICVSCCDIRAAIENYLAARKAYNANGFN